jgi:hypothetical protein
MLRRADIAYLETNGHRYTTYPFGNVTLLVIHEYKLPLGYSPRVIDLLIHIPDTYPDGQLDMWWVYPWVSFVATGTRPQAADVQQQFHGFAPEPTRTWQRFSRHGSWRVGHDDLRTFITAMRATLERDVAAVAA